MCRLPLLLSPLLLLALLLSLLALLPAAAAHGRVLQPPSRASAWRLGLPLAPDYDDDGANCGGFSHQWTVNRGRCGICGDAYDWPAPRPHELGGTFGSGLIVSRYRRGGSLRTLVDLTTSHRGYWQFKLCPDPHDNTQECFDKHPLELETGGTRYYPTDGSVKYAVSYKLPESVVCEHCVLQWRYTAGNNWGVCPNGTQGLGCGNQEQFGACSDISIGGSQDDYDDVPYPLYFYLKHGFFDMEGLGHLLRPRRTPPRPAPNPAPNPAPHPAASSAQRPTPRPAHRPAPSPNHRPVPRPAPRRRNKRRKKHKKRNKRKKKRLLWK